MPHYCLPLTDDLYDALALAAHHEARSLADVIRSALATYCQRPDLATLTHGNRRYPTHAHKLAARRARRALLAHQTKGSRTA